MHTLSFLFIALLIVIEAQESDTGIKRTSLQNVQLEHCQPCYLPSSCEISSLKCKGETRQADIVTVDGETFTSTFDLGPEDLWVSVTCKGYLLDYCQGTPLVNSAETCVTNGYWVPATFSGAVFTLCNQTACSSTTSHCLDPEGLKIELLRGLDLSGATCEPTNLPLMGTSRGRACDGADGCSQNKRCQFRSDFATLTRGIDTYYYSSTDAYMDLPVLSETTQFCIRGNVVGIEFTGQSSTQSAGDFSSIGCLAYCTINTHCITIPKGERGTLRVWHSTAATCGDNRLWKLTMSPSYQPNIVQGAATLKANISFYRKNDYKWKKREGFIAIGLVELGQSCVLREPVEAEEHDCVAYSDRLQCTTNPTYILPEGIMLYGDGGFYLNPRLSASEECLTLILVSSVQESLEYCPTANGWQPVNLEVNSSIIAPPNTIPWPDPSTSLNAPVCSMFNLSPCNFFMKLFYLALWVLIGYLLWKFVISRLIQRCKEKRALKLEEERRERDRKAAQEERRALIEDQIEMNAALARIKSPSVRSTISEAQRSRLASIEDSLLFSNLLS